MPSWCYRYDTDVKPDTALRKLAQDTGDSIFHEDVIRAARQIITPQIRDDDDAELQAIYNAVAKGSKHCPPLRHGVRYTRDPIYKDLFTKPYKLLQMCGQGACAEDCDGQAALVAALCGVVGFCVGLRIVAADPNDTTYSHVYAVVEYPKFNPDRVMGMDTTVEGAYPGWEPPPHPSIQPTTAWLRE